MTDIQPDAPDETPDGGAMPDSELASLLAAHESRAVGYYNSEIADEQAKAINYYYGRMDDLPALDGCSSVVDHTVSVMVDNALAAVLKPFVSADEVVSFEPRQAEDVEQAEQATEYVNYVINCDNAGFLIFHDWFKDALLTKIGVVKAWWEDKTTYETVEARVDAIQLEQARQDPSYLDETDNGDGSFTVKIQQEKPDGREKVVNVPPEEFLISPFARSIEEAPYVAHRPSNFTRSDLIEFGVDPAIVEGLPAFAQGQNEESRAQARYRDEEWFSGSREAIGNDPSQDIIAVLDEYVRVDYDGDGISELRRVVRVDDVILFNEPVDEAPFALICPVPMPHKVYGRSVADLAMEGQKVSTAVTRQTLDNLYKHNNPRPIVLDSFRNEYTDDDLSSTAPGAEIRGRAGELTFAVVPFAADKSFGMLEAIAQNVEERTGIQRKGNGLNAEALKKNSPDTATQAAIDENSRNERAEMIARIFAETGVKRLFKLILKDLIKHQPKERVIKLRNKWVPVDPSGWDPEMDLTISVGLGIGNKMEQMMQADSVLQTMAELQATKYASLIDANKVHNALKRKFTAAGIKNVDDFLVDPENMPPQEPPADPEMVKAQGEAQAKVIDAQTKQGEAAAKANERQLDQQAKAQQALTDIQTKGQIEAMKAQSQAELALAKADFEARLAEANAAREFELEKMKIELQSIVARAKVDSDHDVMMDKNRKGGDLSK